jgi:16S rRNA processing protein RimM
MNNARNKKPDYLAIGKLHRSHGIKGELVMEVFTDFPERLQKNVVVFIGEDHIPVRILSKRKHTEGLLIAFEGFETPEAVGDFRTKFVFVRADDRPKLPEGEYYHHELLGLDVVDENGHSIGNLIEFLETGANEVLVVKSNSGKELLIPGIPSVIDTIDLKNGKITVRLIPGLLQED